MKTKVVFEVNDHVVILDEDNHAQIRVEYQGPSKEIVQLNQPQNVDVFPTIKEIKITDGAFRYKGDLVCLPYKFWFLINDKIREILEDFKRIPRQDYLEILDAQEMILPSIKEEQKKSDELALAILSKDLDKKNKGNLFGKVKNAAKNLFSHYQETKDTYNEKDQRLIEEGFNVISKLLKEMENDKQSKNHKKLK